MKQSEKKIIRETIKELKRHSCIIEEIKDEVEFRWSDIESLQAVHDGEF